MMTLERWFWSRISGFLESEHMSPTRFGRLALGDPNLLRQIEGGRSLTLRNADRVLAFVAERESAGARDPPRRRRYRRPPPRMRRPKWSGAATAPPMHEGTRPPTRILRLPEVQARTGLSRTTIYQWGIEGRFPRPVRLGTRCVGWIEAEVEAWIRERIAERRSSRA